MCYLPEGYKKDTSCYSLQQIQELIENGRPVAGRAIMYGSDKILRARFGGYEVRIPFKKAADGIEEGRTKEIAVISRIGRPIHFLLTDIEMDAQGQAILIGDRAAAQQLCLSLYLNRLVPGDIIPCIVTHLEPFGAFCDVGCGISALLPIDCMSVSRIRSPADRVCTGQTLRCVVKTRDPQGRLVLSLKELLGTWQENAAAYSAGATVVGVVRTVENYGVFVELAPNLAGLAEAYHGVQPGDTVSVYIKSILPDRMKIKLVILQKLEEPLPAGPLHYYLEADHLNHWRYSPASCSRILETTFSTAPTEPAVHDKQLAEEA